MEKDANGVLAPTVARQKELLHYLPIIEEIAEIDQKYLFQLDSCDISPPHWEIIAEEIANSYDQYDGFIVIMGSDTMAYAATAMSFMLGNLGKPVIFTDTLLPINEIASDNHSNIINAVRFAIEDLAEVSIVFGYRLTRGNRSKKTHDFAIGSFASPNFKALGEIGLGLRLSSSVKRRHDGALELHTRLVKDVVVISLFPGITNEHILGMVPPRTKGIVIEGYGAGNIPLGPDSGIEESISNIADQDIVVVIDTQCMYGGVEYGRYVGGAFARRHGALSSRDMTAEAAITKLMWVLGQTEKHSEIKQLYETNLAGELSEIYGF